MCEAGQPDPVVSAPRVVVTSALLHLMAPHTPEAILEQRVVPVQRALDESDAATPMRAAGVLARMFEETADLRLVQEEPDPHDPHFLRYEQGAYVHVLGNVHPGDGELFSGLGLDQITGRDNFLRFTRWVQEVKGLPVDFVATPKLLLDPRYLGFEVAWYNATHPAILVAADAGDIDEISCQVNAGCSRAAWIARHGELIDYLEAKARNAAMVAAGTVGTHHGIYGLNATRLRYRTFRQVLGIPLAAAA